MPTDAIDSTAARSLQRAQKRGAATLRGLELPLRVGRYLLTEEIASGGMAVVYKGRLDGPSGFARTVAVKRLHSQYAKDREFVARFAAEARLAARIHHANVVQTLDFVETHGELFLVLEYVEGRTLSRLLAEARERVEPLPVSISAGILLGALQGLAAAHELCDEHGVPFGLVHRDFSPQNLLVGIDGVARVLDFGVAKIAAWNLTRQNGHVAGKLAYMSPEQSSAADVDQRSDVFSAGIMLWEALAGSRLFGGHGLTDVAVLRRVLEQPLLPPSKLNPQVSPALDALVMSALERDPSQRLATARQFASALQASTAVAASSEISEYLRRHGSELQSDSPRGPYALAKRTALVEALTLSTELALNPSGLERAAFASDADIHKEGTLTIPSNDVRALNRGSAKRAAIFSVCVALAVALVGTVRWLPRHAALVATAPVANPTLVHPAAAKAASTPVLPEIALPVARDSEPRVVPVSSEPPPSASVAAHQPRPPQRAVSRSIKHAAPPVAQANCAVPTYTDSEGISHFKAGCL